MTAARAASWSVPSGLCKKKGFFGTSRIGDDGELVERATASDAIVGGETISRDDLARERRGRCLCFAQPLCRLLPADRVPQKDQASLRKLLVPALCCSQFKQSRSDPVCTSRPLPVSSRCHSHGRVTSQVHERMARSRTRAPDGKSLSVLLFICHPCVHAGKAGRHSATCAKRWTVAVSDTHERAAERRRHQGRGRSTSVTGRPN